MNSSARDEIILMVGLAFTYLLLLLAKQLQFISLWVSLLILVSVAFYYSFTFFRSLGSRVKFGYFLLLIPVIISYFALIYKAFGIIDTSTGETIKPEWLDAYYFSVVTWTTLGYGDFKPISELKLWVMVEAMLGYMFMGLLVSKLLFISQRPPNA